MNIEIFGESERGKTAKSVFTDKDLGVENVKLLPIPSSRDGAHIAGTDILLSDFEKELFHGDFVVGYGLSKSFKEKLALRGIECYDAAFDEKFLLENAYITAIGTLGYVLGTAKKIPGDMRFGIIGYGRIGASLTRLFLFLGAKVKIFSSKKLTRIELGLCGIDSPEIELADFSDTSLSGLDFVLNTAPTNLSYLFPKKQVPDGMRVIDLASGDSFPGVLGVEYLPSLPERMYPESAGAVYANQALAWLRNKEK
ncbi:MAG: hypothetical protein IJW38_00150 [Clostridia bacterium]|nr:hypothetical protein [Clostridia bacterium]